MSREHSISAPRKPFNARQPTLQPGKIGKLSRSKIDIFLGSEVVSSSRLRAIVEMVYDGGLLSRNGGRWKILTLSRVYTHTHTHTSFTILYRPPAIPANKRAISRRITTRCREGKEETHARRQPCWGGEARLPRFAREPRPAGATG